MSVSYPWRNAERPLETPQKSSALGYLLAGLACILIGLVVGR